MTTKHDIAYINNIFLYFKSQHVKILRFSQIYKHKKTNKKYIYFNVVILTNKMLA